MIPNIWESKLFQSVSIQSDALRTKNTSKNGAFSLTISTLYNDNYLYYNCATLAR